MTDQGDGAAVAESRREEERRIAHEGTLARFAGTCARRPWRVVGGWAGIFVVLIGLNVAFHGKLINDFKIPGSDTQKATDLITAKFGAQKGAALRVVLADLATRGETASRIDLRGEEVIAVRPIPAAAAPADTAVVQPHEARRG